MAKEITAKEALKASQNVNMLRVCSEKYMPEVWEAIDEASKLGYTKVRLRWNETYSEYAIQILSSKGFLASRYEMTDLVTYYELSISWGIRK